MIPNTDDLTELEEVVLPSYTYGIDLVNKRINGFVDESQAMLQAVNKMLDTERYAFSIYSGQYGGEFERLIGKDMDFVISDLQRVVEDCLFADDRVQSINDFTINQTERDTLEASFVVVTDFGELSITREVTLV